MREPSGSFCTLPEKAATIGAEGDDGEGAIIYGREGCPHTNRARRELPRARFIDVVADPVQLDEMLRLSGGARRIPVIVRGKEVSVGYRRGS